MGNLRIEDIMTKSLFEISACSTVKLAREMMLKNDIRHLPVFEHRKLIGVVSDRDICKVSENDNYQDMKVDEVMSQNLYVVREFEPLRKVVQKMCKQKYGCTIVVDHEGWTKGIFTTTDALELLEKFLDEKDPVEKKNFRTVEDYFNRFYQRPNLLSA